MKRYEYRVMKCFCEEHEIHTYGISVWQRQTGKSVEICTVKDISPDKRAVLKLTKRCRRAQLDFIHLMDVVEDFLS